MCGVIWSRDIGDSEVIWSRFEVNWSRARAIENDKLLVKCPHVYDGPRRMIRSLQELWRNRDMEERNYDLAAKLSRAGDDLLVGPEEVAALSGLSASTIGKRKVASMPSPMPGVRRLRWRLGDIRRWMRGPAADSADSNATARPPRRGRPTKAEEMARLDRVQP